jgi:hypothetical protein
MTLKEKFKERLYNQSHDDSECLRIRFENIDKVIDSQEIIADEFAIGFAEWHLNLSKSDDWEKFDYNTTEKLLEIYKKEKRL